jgi:trimeric autotransporter adhesin
MKTKNIPTSQLRNSRNHPSSRHSFFLIPLALLCFALLPGSQAVSPAPDGGYPGGNTAEGQNALFSLTSGGFNTAVGFFSLRSNATGQFNTAIGAGTLLASTADENTATGAGALLSNTTGADNTANGAFALFSNTTGGFNTANGDRALFINTTGAQNTATGISALTSNTSGSSNTANGAYALANNTTANDNTANGMFALFSNTTGNENTATGSQALFSNTTGSANVAIGFQALSSNTDSSHTAIGASALLANTTGFQNTAIGFQALQNNTEGSGNTAIGSSAGISITGGGNVCIGVNVSGDAGANDTTWIRNVYGSVASSRAVYVDSDGKIGTLASSRRYKEEIKPIKQASEVLYRLKPVSFRYKKEIDRSHALSFGLIAEEVANVDPDLVTPDRDGKPETVRYEAVNAMLLNEFLKEHRKVEDLKKELQATVSQQQKQIDALTAGLQKVSAQFGASKPAMQKVLNSQ